MNYLTTSSLMQSKSARIEQARHNFFEEGRSPTGMVGSAVFESWARCLRLHGNPRRRAEFEPVTSSRAQLALTKNKLLRQAWADELPRLESILSTTSCAAMLTDSTGVLIGASCVGRSHEKLMPVATRVGVNLSEEAVGTTAPGVAARTGKPVLVQGGEHFFDSVMGMHCAAAPVHDIHGRLAGVLDISSEGMPFEFDAAAVAGLYASAIENRLLVAQSTEHLVLRFQVAPELLDSSMVGLIGVDDKGRLVWENAVARSLLGATQPAPQGLETALPEDRLGLNWQQIASLPTSGALPLVLPNGLTVWARAQMYARDGRRQLTPSCVLSGSHGWDVGSNSSNDARAGCSQRPELECGQGIPETSPKSPIAVTHDQAPERLRESSLELIRGALQACGGNVSQAAVKLGVSRGLIYRRLRAAASTEALA